MDDLHPAIMNKRVVGSKPRGGKKKRCKREREPCSVSDTSRSDNCLLVSLLPVSSLISSHPFSHPKRRSKHLIYG